MSSIPESSLSFLASDSAPLTSTATKVLLTAVGLSIAAYTIRCASPMRQTRILVAAITDTEKAYLEAIEAGVSDVPTAEELARCMYTSHRHINPLMLPQPPAQGLEHPRGEPP
jgi:hypothetical protein